MEVGPLFFDFGQVRTESRDATRRETARAEHAANHACYIAAPHLFCCVLPHSLSLTLSLLSLSQGGLPEKPGLSSEAFLKLCKRSGIRWAITCRDATHTWYHRGLAEGGSFDSVLNDLQAEINLVQPREVVCIGSSMGGYAAIRAGLYLKASAIIAYSPQVLLSTSDRLAAMILPMAHLDPYLLKMHLAAELEDFRPVTLIQAVEQCPGFDATVQVRACARACACASF